MKKRFAFMCLFVLLVLLLSGCAEPGADKEASLTNNGETTVTTVPSSTDKESSTTTTTTTKHVPSTTVSSELPTTTTRRVTPYTITIAPEDFRTDVILHLDKSVYTTEDEVKIEIENKTGSLINIDYVYYILKHEKGNEFTIFLSEMGYILISQNLPNNDTWKASIKLPHYLLEANEQYKLAKKIDGKWVVADFETVAPPKTNAAPSTTGRSRYTSSTKLKPEDFHTDILMHLDKSVYTTEDTVQVEIENKTGGEIGFGYYYYVLKQQKNDEWTKIYHGQGTITAWRIMKGDGTFKTSIKLAPYELAANEQYKLALEIEGKWVVADFSTIAPPKTNAASTTTRSPDLTTATTTSRRANPAN